MWSMNGDDFCSVMDAKLWFLAKSNKYIDR
jgi:hypothetical protein